MKNRFKMVKTILGYKKFQNHKNVSNDSNKIVNHNLFNVVHLQELDTAPYVYYAYI
jgi:hypothetical protein